MTHPPHTPARIRPAFTLLELLVVIVIIGILVAVALTVATRVSGGSKVRLTEDVLRICDQTRSAAAAALEGTVPTKYVDGLGNEFPIVDASPDASSVTTGYQQATIGLYFLAISKVQGLEDMFKGIDPRLVQHVSTLDTDPSDATPATPFGTPKDQAGIDLPTLIVHDAFTDRTYTKGDRKLAIRFVHPTFDNGYGPYFDGTNTQARTVRKVSYNQGGNPAQPINMRRSYRPASGTIGDADEGICAGRVPYFYSVGPDGDPGARADNVYSNRPTFPMETAKFVD